MPPCCPQAIPSHSFAGGKGGCLLVAPGQFATPSPLLGGNSGGAMGTRGGCKGSNDHVGVDGGVLAVVVPPPLGNATLPDARMLTAVNLAANDPASLLAVRQSPQQQSTGRLQGEDANVIIVKGGLVKCECKSSQEQQSPDAPTTSNPALNNQLTSKQVYA